MKFQLPSAALLLALTAAPLAPAQLAMLDEAPFFGYHSAFANKRFLIGLAADGKILLRPMSDKSEPVSSLIQIEIKPVIEETMPDGKVAMRQVKVESLQTDKPITANLEKVLVTGKTAGDAAFELKMNLVSSSRYWCADQVLRGGGTHSRGLSGQGCLG